MKKELILLAFLGTLLSFYQCQKVQIENLNEPNTVSALTGEYVETLVNETSTNMLKHIIGFTGIYPNLMSDQTTTTNGYKDFVSFSDQPRREIQNTSLNNDIDFSYGKDWKRFNNFIFSANLAIDFIEHKREKIIINGVNKSQEVLATSYFIKGLSQGYLALLFDKSYIINPDTDVVRLQFSSYVDVSKEAVKNIERSINIANISNDYKYFIYKGYSLRKEEFERVANSFMAKIIINTPRNKQEGSNTDYVKVLELANKGIIDDFNPKTNGGMQFYNEMQDWSTYQITNRGGYLPVDFKVINLLDNAHPKDFPSQQGVIPEPFVSSDPRKEYFEYHNVFWWHIFSPGNINRSLVSNYTNVRFFSDNDRGTLAGLSTDIFHVEELDYIKAEAALRVYGASSAADILNASARFTKGTKVTQPTAVDVEKALFYEYSIELDLATTIGTQWFFMRRYDLLQKGTPLSYPVPIEELSFRGNDMYTFGGENNSGKIGTASGDNSWKN